MDLVDIVKHRSNPGIIILEPRGEYVYLNDQARAMAASFASHELDGVLQHIASTLRPDLSISNGAENLAEVPTVISNDKGIFALRPFMVPMANGATDPSSVLILIEQISTRTAIDLEAALQQYALTRRERDIVRLLFKGLCNKAIAQQLTIGPYTVKDHLKKIMLKLNVNSRIGIVSKLLKLS